MKIIIAVAALLLCSLALPTEREQSTVAEKPTVVEVKKQAEPVPETPVAMVSEPAPAPVIETSTPAVLDNETIIWNFLIAQGFTREQVAGVMGNLQQEHNFNTSDEPGGLGIAQWIGARRSNLVAKGNYLDLNVQLNYLMEELNGSEYRAKAAIQASTTVDQATVAFQNKFERCGQCEQGTRIMYAYKILGRH